MLVFGLLLNLLPLPGTCGGVGDGFVVKVGDVIVVSGGGGGGGG